MYFTINISLLLLFNKTRYIETNTWCHVARISYVTNTKKILVGKFDSKTQVADLRVDGRTTLKCAL